MPPAVVAVIAAAFWLQGTTTPLKKSDLIRLLSTSLPPAEIADLVQRRCVSFVPSSRDKADLRALGADDQLLRRLDECARKVAPLRATAQLREAIVPVGEVARVQVRNQRSRWGACSARRAITLNWRLVQMPESVADYVMLHELMHLKHHNHSPRFWRAVAGVCPWWREAEAWLRRWGRELL